MPRCDPVIQKLILNTTFEELITTQHGVTISRALVNVVIDQQIGQQISVKFLILCIGGGTNELLGRHDKRGFTTALRLILQHGRCNDLQG